MASQHRVVIVGGGFGGLSAALGFGRAPVEVTLVDRCNYHLFQPLLYQVATGTLSPANIASPLRNILKRHKNTRVLLAEATGIDASNRRVILSDGSIDTTRWSSPPARAINISVTTNGRNSRRA